MVSIANKVINQKSAVLHLIKGEKEDGKNFYAYILFPADVYEEIKEKLETEGINISKYGIVIHSDYGDEVPEGIHEEVLKHYKENFLKN